LPTITIRLMEPMTELIGRAELKVQTGKEAALSDALTEMGNLCGDIVKQQILAPDGDFHPYILASLNGEDIRGLQGIHTRVNDGDVILLALNITGG
jgi:hypothetical protein